MSLIDPHKLRPNPGNTIFDPLPTDVYEALKADIAQRGLLNPILCTSDYTIIAGHHRLQAALELGLAHVAVDIQDVGPDEAEDRLIADNVLRRQLSLGEQAKLIRRLKERAGVHRGNNQFLGGASAIIAEATPNMSERKQRMLDHTNDLIPPLFERFSAGALPITVADALASLPPADQQALWDTLGAEQVAALKAPTIQQAKREAAPSHTESEIQAILQRLSVLQADNDRLERQLAESHPPAESDPDPDPEVLARLEAAESEREALAQEVDRLRNQPPSVAERIVEKIVAVEKPDPAQAARIDALTQSLETTTAELTLLKTRRKDLLHYDQERERLQAEISRIKTELARMRDSTNLARHRLTQSVQITAILRKLLAGLADIPELEALLAGSEGSILPSDRDLARNVAEQLQKASQLIFDGVRQFTQVPPMDVWEAIDPNDPMIQQLREAQVLDDHDSIVTPAP